MIRTFASLSLRWIIKKLAQLTIWKYRPGIIGITGSVGKTSTKMAVEAVLGGERKIRASKGNLNNELGLPLTILGNWRGGDFKLVSREQPPGTARLRKLFFWIKVIVVSIFNVIFSRRSSYPEVLILEYGADRPGDIKYLLGIARPNISIVTAIGAVPVHVEFYGSSEEVAREKSRLVEYLPVAGIAILNSDDPTVMRLRERTRAHITTFGFGKEAAMRVTRLEYRSDISRPLGISFKLEHAGNSVPVRLDGVFGKPTAAAAAAAAAVGIAFGMNLVKISEKLAGYRTGASRMQIVPGIHETSIIDDSYNASPLSMEAALDALKHIPAKRKIAILGDMLEIGDYAADEHERIGRLAAKSANMLILVGAHAKFTAEGARKAGLRKNNIHLFETANEAMGPTAHALRDGDLILVKGSHAMELGKIVEEIKMPVSKDFGGFFSQYA